ncbi:MAG: transglutaminase family protein [Pseudomonadota bacterium]
MVLHAALTHKTTYDYDRLTEMGPQIIRLRPAPHARTPILSYGLQISPTDHWVNWQQDPFGNYLARVVFPEPVDHFNVTVDLVADMAVINPFDFFVAEEAKDHPFAYEADVAEELKPYLTCDPVGPWLQKYITTIRRDPQVTIDFLCDLNRQLASDIRYLIRMEPGVQTPEETLERRAGSCRDTAWLMVQILRNLGYAARFVSGYLIQLTADVKALDGPSGTETDFTDLHAWAEVYVPGAGWIGLDGTSGLLTGEGHIPLAATPRPSSAAPITGKHTFSNVSFSFHMDVQRVHETPRVTLPYSDATWHSIVEVGDAIDTRLQQGDVRLTMGGEPTFVAAENNDRDEWSTDAVGPTKRRYAEDLIRRLRTRLAPGGLLHFGQGKWYPGEPLPRWGFSLYWRGDGQPLWQNPELIAADRVGLDEADDKREDAPKPATPELAEAFAAALCETLGLPNDSAMPAYEDAAHFMLIEQKIPVNRTLETADIEDPAERKRLLGVLDRGVETPASYVLPIQSWQSAASGRRKWITERWTLKRDKLFLTPGDSAAGYRLPLGSLPGLPKTTHPHVLPGDPFADAPELKPAQQLFQERREETRASLFQKGPPGSEIDGAVRTAVSVEPRDGVLCVFLPPLEDGADYAALIAAIEETASACETPVHVEGYEPPSDQRLQVLKVTPDPGVIEVNVPPTSTWREAIELTTGLYDDAHQARLSAEKFLLDGRHTGTGGGNHIVLGGATPADSPFLRRPDLLASLILYWQHHPALSYLFSGLFIGPTSQAPRIDEGRHEQIHELEIALAQVPFPKAGELADPTLPPWLVDRLFRNLLIDVTGNTHRAEICIDKLYSPDGPTGRLGLVEFRSFEMPPHARMSLAQQLLLRAIIVRLWERPYRGRPVRWGTTLHDKFMLPTPLWADLAVVIRDLNTSGLPIALDWFEPHRDFRCPLLGKVSAGDVEVELRQALEPWHVLGEVGMIGGTARYVDSSLERVELKVRGLTGDRYVVTCNEVRVPLTPTDTSGEAVAGIRYRAWQPPSALHPTIGVHVPLIFDIYDTWTGRAIGGCRYHVSHPGGRNFEVIPVNAYEAEGRRLSRFETTGHTPGGFEPISPPDNPDYPTTLDLRRLGV